MNICVCVKTIHIKDIRRNTKVFSTFMKWLLFYYSFLGLGFIRNRSTYFNLESKRYSVKSTVRQISLILVFQLRLGTYTTDSQRLFLIKFLVYYKET